MKFVATHGPEVALVECLHEFNAAARWMVPRATYCRSGFMTVSMDLMPVFMASRSPGDIDSVRSATTTTFMAFGAVSPQEP